MTRTCSNFTSDSEAFDVEQTKKKQLKASIQKKMKTLSQQETKCVRNYCLKFFSGLCFWNSCNRVGVGGAASTQVLHARLKLQRAAEARSTYFKCKIHQYCM